MKRVVWIALFALQGDLYVPQSTESALCIVLHRQKCRKVPRELYDGLQRTLKEQEWITPFLYGKVAFCLYENQLGANAS